MRIHKWKDDIMTSIKTITPKDFIFRVLSGVAIGIVAGLVPNAILGEIFSILWIIIQFLKHYWVL